MKALEPSKSGHAVSLSFSEGVYKSPDFRKKMALENFIYEIYRKTSAIELFLGKVLCQPVYSYRFGATLFFVLGIPFPINKRHATKNEEILNGKLHFLRNIHMLYIQARN